MSVDNPLKKRRSRISEAIQILAPLAVAGASGYAAYKYLPKIVDDIARATEKTRLDKSISLPRFLRDARRDTEFNLVKKITELGL